MRPSTPSMMWVGALTLGLGLGLGTSPARAQGPRSGGYATNSAAWSGYTPGTSTASGYALNTTSANTPARVVVTPRPYVNAASGWAGYAPGTAWSGYLPGSSWVSYSPRVGRVMTSASHYRELGSGRPIALPKPWLPGSP
jgi:hypothetical protein